MPYGLAFARKVRRRLALPDKAVRASIRNPNLAERTHRWWCAPLCATAGGIGHGFLTNRCSSARVSFAAFTSILLCATLARADPPSRSFVGNFIGNDATVENYLSISGGVDRTQNFESLYLEKTISSKSSFSLFVGYQRLEQEGEDASISGFTNLGLGYKHVLLALPANEFILTVNPTLELPIGDKHVSETHTRAGGDVLFQKGFADLPESLGLLRPAAIEGDAGFESKVTGARDDLLNADLELEYSLDYLDAHVAGSVPRALRELTPHLDFDYAQYLSAHNNSSAPDFELTPAIAWMNDTFEVNLGVQVALNRASSGTGTVAFVWLLGVSYDQLVPAVGWNLFH